ncbi:MAG: Unknown protein [uncultured Sulfurovum sp.]|uniref:Uncharacterized protein n=1 Tax=uncultured Sulfurovum sp. TaxID=269237 RepID=A0A6S6S647_9BACT|nr:MAG: Unknown protein [uncultured Sulfurovum sp.]
MENNVTDYIDLGLAEADYGFLMGITANLIGFTFMFFSIFIITYISRKS